MKFIVKRTNDEIYKPTIKNKLFIISKVLNSYGLGNDDIHSIMVMIEDVLEDKIKEINKIINNTLNKIKVVE